MELLLRAMGAIGLLLAGVGLLYGSVELRRLRELLKTGILRVLVESHQAWDCCGSGVITASLGGYAVYIFSDGKWQLHSDASLPGYDPVVPRIPGAYEGQVVRTFSVLRGQAS